MSDSAISSSTSTSDRCEDTKEIKNCISEALRVFHDSRDVSRYLKRDPVPIDQVQEMHRLMMIIKNFTDQLDRLNSKIWRSTVNIEDSGSEPDYF